MLPQRKLVYEHAQSEQQKAGKGRGELGQSLVETAAILPILALLLAIVVDASRAFDAMIVLTNAVRQGARYASLEPSPAESEIVNMVVVDIEGSGTNVSSMGDFGDRGTVTLEVEPAVAVTVTVRSPRVTGCVT